LSILTHEEYMQQAITIAADNPRAPFAALLVHRRTGEVISEGVNRWHKIPTWHGEIDVINRCAVRNPDMNWSDLRLYTTAEPCCMCQGAILWAGIPEVVYGTSIATLKRLGWNQINIAADEVARRTPFALCKITGGVLEQRCNALFETVARRS
jgi:tRNA(Arg) A34 adenosine deaminase TadA